MNTQCMYSTIILSKHAYQQVDLQVDLLLGTLQKLFVSSQCTTD